MLRVVSLLLCRSCSLVRGEGHDESNLWTGGKKKRKLLGNAVEPEHPIAVEAVIEKRSFLYV